MAETAAGGFRGTRRIDVLHQLGAGGMGIVYAAEGWHTARQVALTTLHWLDGEEIFRLKREFCELADTSHPNLAGLYDLVVTLDHCFFTMENGARAASRGARAQGRRRAAARVGRSLERAEIDALRGLLRQLVDGLSALHETGRVHRDIQPSNVWVTPEGRVVILDFGAVTSIAPSRRAGHRDSKVVGTLAYMSPEQGMGPRHVGIGLVRRGDDAVRVPVGPAALRGGHPRRPSRPSRQEQP